MNLWRSQATTTRVKVSGSSAPAPVAPVKLTPWHRAPNTVTLVTAEFYRDDWFSLHLERHRQGDSAVVPVTCALGHSTIFIFTQRRVGAALSVGAGPGLGIMFASFILFLSPFLAGFYHFGFGQLRNHLEAHSSTRYACVFKHWTMACCCAASRARPPAASCISHVQIILAYIYKDSLLFIISELGSWD